MFRVWGRHSRSQRSPTSTTCPRKAPNLNTDALTRSSTVLARRPSLTVHVAEFSGGAFGTHLLVSWCGGHDGPMETLRLPLAHQFVSRTQLQLIATFDHHDRRTSAGGAAPV